MSLGAFDLAVVLNAEVNTRNADKYNQGVKDTKLKLPVFKTVTLGKYKTGEDYIKALESRGYPIDDDLAACLITGKIKPAYTQIEVDLVSAFVGEDLGYKEGLLGRTTNLYPRARDLGLEICPAEVGLALLLELPNEFNLVPKECRFECVAMEPIIFRSEPGPQILFISCNNNKRTRLDFTSIGGFQSESRPDERLIFIQPRPETSVQLARVLSDSRLSDKKSDLISDPNFYRLDVKDLAALIKGEGGAERVRERMKILSTCTHPGIRGEWPTYPYCPNCREFCAHPDD